MNKYSVALCTYNGEAFIEEQITSILNQTIPPDEIIVSDDGSKDKAVSIIENIAKRSSVRIVFVSNNKTHGVTYNFYNAISLCRNNIIFTSDQDDVWLKDKAESILKVFAEKSNARLVFSNGQLVDSSKKDIGMTLWESVGITKKMLKHKKWYKYLLKDCLVTGSAMAFKKDVFEANNYIPKYWLHDGWFSIIASFDNSLFACDKITYLYRQHGNNTVGAVIDKTESKNLNERISDNKALDDLRSIKEKTFIEVKENLLSLMSSHQIKRLDKCIKFWRQLSNINNSNKFAGFCVIAKHLFNGNYSKFYSGLRGAFKDFLNLIKR